MTNKNYKTTKLTTSVVTSLLLATSLYSQELSTIEIVSPSIKTNEIDASFTSEIYTQNDIKKTNSKNLYDFLNSSTSITTVPSSGNDFVHKIDMRGYGLTNGHKAIVITLNGRRMNNIDSLPQFLSTINIDQIEKIEIIKGGSSVEFGDGANAGSISIITKAKYENSIKAYAGSNGTQYSFASLGYQGENIILNASTDYFKSDGSRYIDSANTKKDSKWAKNKSISSIIFPNDNLEISLGKTFSKIYNNYSNFLTLDEFNNAVDEYGSAGTSSEVYIVSNILSTGASYHINNNYSVDINYNEEDKLNENVSYSSKTNYDYKDYSSRLNYKDDSLQVSFGIDWFDGLAKGSSDETTKDNLGSFFNSKYNLDNKTIISFGARYEKVDYSYATSTVNNTYDKNLNAFDLGINRKLDENSSIYANINKSFQTADIDMFFTYLEGVKTFNIFLDPTISKNINIGYNNFTDNNKLKLGLFYSKLENEIYLFKETPSDYGDNTNLDKTKKYGLEFFDRYQFTNEFYGSVNYNYIISKIVEEDLVNGAYDGKYMPGVSKHNITLALGYKYQKYNIDLIHKYRSEAYAAEDFENNFSQKQKAYNSTDLSLAYNYKNYEFFTKINNLFEQKNATWTKDDVITPINFERTYYAGMKYKF